MAVQKHLRQFRSLGTIQGRWKHYRVNGAQFRNNWGSSGQWEQFRDDGSTTKLMEGSSETMRDKGSILRLIMGAIHKQWGHLKVNGSSLELIAALHSQ